MSVRLRLQPTDSTARGGRSRILRLLLAVAALVVALVAPQAVLSPAYGATGPTSITVDASTDPSLPVLAGIPAGSLPAVLTSVDTDFRLKVALWNGSAPASYNTDMTVTFTVPGPGHLTVAQATIPARTSSITVMTTYTAAAASISVKASVGTKKSLLTASTGSFPVELHLNYLNGDDGSLKNGTAGADGSGCTTVDAAHPMCGVVSLPNGATGNVALSLGVCPSGTSCARGALVTQLLANMTGLYTRSAPAKMTIVCDKSLCGKGGVSKYVALWTQSATGDLLAVPACPSKGVIGPTQTYCTDYVSSSRDNAADLRLVVLFLDDVRGTI